MKCPHCGKNYSDENLAYCLTDGTPLIDDAPVSQEVVTKEVVGQSSENPRSFVLGIVTALAAVIIFLGAGAGVYFYLANSAADVDSSSVSNSNKQPSNIVGEGFEAKDTPEEKKSYVHSPRDGFLALRSIPNHKIGKLIAKIPDGTEIKLEGCRGRIKIGKNSGRWCRTSYNSKKGWVFSAWIRTR